MKNMRNKMLWLFVFMVTCLLCVLPAVANALVVNTIEDVTDANDGLLSFREAILQAGDGDTITFSEDILLDGERQVILLGPAGRIVKEDDSYPAFSIQGPGAERLAIDGNGGQILVAYASLNISGLSFTGGGGNREILYLYGSQTTIEDSVFSDNHNTNTTRSIIMIPDGDSTISNSVFENNSSGASGILSLGGSNTDHSVDGCTLSGNRAFSGGSIIINAMQNLNATIQNSTFKNNASGTGGEGGAAIHASGIHGPMNLTVDNCFFTGNTSEGSAGAIYADGWKRSSFSEEDMPDNIQIKNSTFYSNRSNISATSENSGGGGAIYGRWLDSPVIEKCVFISNDLDTDVVNCDDFGGGALHIADTSDLTIDSCYFYKNQANYDCKGGGIYSLRSNIDLKHTSFQANAVESTPGNTTKGAGVAWEEGDLDLLNCTLARHVSGEVIWGESNSSHALNISNSTFYNNGQDGKYNSIHSDGPVNLKNSIMLVNQEELEDITDDAGELTAYQGDFNLVLEKESNQHLVFDLVGFDTGDYDTVLIGSNLSNMMTDFPDGQTRLPVLPLIKNSPARDVGDSTDLYGNTVSGDQRGGSRPQGYGYDMGAFEYGVNTYEITATSSAGGVVSPDFLTVFEEGSAEFNITTYKGYVLSDLLLDGTSVSADVVKEGEVWKYTLQNVIDSHDLKATFEIDPEMLADAGALSFEIKGENKGPQQLDTSPVSADAVRSISFSSLTSADIGEDLSDTDFATGLSFEIGFVSPDAGTAVTQLDLVMEVSRDLLGQETCETIDSGDVLETAFFENVSIYKVVSSDAYDLFEIASAGFEATDFFEITGDNDGYYVSMIMVIADEAAPDGEDPLQALEEGQDSYFFVYDGVKDGTFTDPIVALRKSTDPVDPVNPDNSGGGTCSLGAFTPLAALLLLPLLLMFKK